MLPGFDRVYKYPSESWTKKKFYLLIVHERFLRPSYATVWGIPTFAVFFFCRSPRKMNFGIHRGDRIAQNSSGVEEDFEKQSRFDRAPSSSYDSSRRWEESERERDLSQIATEKCSNSSSSWKTKALKILVFFFAIKPKVFDGKNKCIRFRARPEMIAMHFLWGPPNDELSSTVLIT